MSTKPRCTKPRWRTIPFDALDYPPLLRDLPDPPRQLFVNGSLIADNKSVTIVGTRKASDEALTFTRELAAALVNEKFAVWSGGALGIDTAAHEGALDAGGITVSVLAGGERYLSPPQNVGLFERIVENGGALVTREGPDTKPGRPRFFARNRILAAATRLTIVVECALQSGARSTAQHARSLGRPWGAVLQAPWTKQGQGCAEEVRLGAIPILSTKHAVSLAIQASGSRLTGAPHQLTLASLGLHMDPEQRPAPKSIDWSALDETKRIVLESIAAGSCTLDALCERLSLGAGQVAVTLTELALDGLILQSAVGVELAPGVSLGQDVAE